MRFALIFLALIAAGCAQAPPQMVYVAPEMLPKAFPAKPPPTESRFGGQTLVVAPVTGVGAAAGAEPAGMIPGATFREAMIESIQDAGLFASVSQTGASRYVLSADILEQTATAYGATVAVRYALSDTQIGSDIWENDIAATYSFPLKPAASTASGQTQAEALDRACANNFRMMIERLAHLNDRSTE